MNDTTTSMMLTNKNLEGDGYKSELIASFGKALKAAASAMEGLSDLEEKDYNGCYRMTANNRATKYPFLHGLLGLSEKQFLFLLREISVVDEFGNANKYVHLTQLLVEWNIDAFPGNSFSGKSWHLVFGTTWSGGDGGEGGNSRSKIKAKHCLVDLPNCAATKALSTMIDRAMQRTERRKEETSARPPPIAVPNGDVNFQDLGGTVVTPSERVDYPPSGYGGVGASSLPYWNPSMAPVAGIDVAAGGIPSTFFFPTSVAPFPYWNPGMMPPITGYEASTMAPVASNNIPNHFPPSFGPNASEPLPNRQEPFQAADDEWVYQCAPTFIVVGQGDKAQEIKIPSNYVLIPKQTHSMLTRKAAVHAKIMHNVDKKKCMQEQPYHCLLGAVVAVFASIPVAALETLLAVWTYCILNSIGIECSIEQALSISPSHTTIETMVRSVADNQATLSKVKSAFISRSVEQKEACVESFFRSDA